MYVIMYNSTSTIIDRGKHGNMETWRVNPGYSHSRPGGRDKNNFVSAILIGILNFELCLIQLSI